MLNKMNQFFNVVFGPDFPGLISIWEKQTETTKFYNNNQIDHMIQYISAKSRNRDVYFGCGLRANKQMSGRGKFDDIIGLPGFWMDLDLQSDVHKSNDYPATKEEAMQILKQFPLAPTIVISSGYGLQIYWLFENPWIFEDDDERKKAQKLSQRFQNSITAIFQEHGYKLDNTADLPRNLRIPGTLNHKKEPAAPVKILKMKNAQNRRYNTDCIIEAIEACTPQTKDRSLKPAKRLRMKGDYPGSSVENILQNCPWFRHCQTDARTLSEPEWFYMLTVVSFCEEPLPWAYQLSQEYDGFDRDETRKRVIRIRKSWTMPATCDYVAHNFGSGYCDKCTHTVKTPFQLGVDKNQDSLEQVGFGFNEDGKASWLNGNIFARYILNRMKLIYTESGFFYEYQDGVWNRLEHNKLSRKLRDLIHEFVPDFWKKSIEHSYIAALKREAPYQMLNPDRNVLNLKNGVLDLTTFKCRTHNPQYYSSVQLSISFDEDADCPKFDKFLHDIFDGDTERIKVVEEVLGYCLTADTSAQKAFFFYGQGSNGKSLLADIILNLCGVQNTSAIPLVELDKAFSRYELVDKLLNMTTENEVAPTGLNTAPFKAIVSGDPIQVEKKYEQAFTYRPFCKLIFSLNTLPYSRDRSWAFQRRLIVIPFNRTFRDTDPDYQNYNKLRASLLEELPGILNRALLGLKRLRNNNYVFSNSEAISNLQTEYKQILNPYTQFVDEMVDQGDKTDKILNKKMHTVFETWCAENGHDRIAKGSHLKRLNEIRNAMKDARIDFDCGKACKSGGERYMGGIRFKIRNRQILSDISEMET